MLRIGEEANGMAPRFAWVRKENIVFVGRERQMERTSIEAMQKDPTVRFYAPEFDVLYSGASDLEEK
jgi:hypothetical protein